MYLELSDNGRPYPARPMRRGKRPPKELMEFFMWVPGDEEMGQEGAWVREDLLDDLPEDQFRLLESLQPEPLNGFFDFITTEAGRERRAERRARRARRQEARTKELERTGKTGIERAIGGITSIFKPKDAGAPAGATQRDLPVVTGGLDVNKPFDPTYWIIGGVVIVGGIIAYSALKKK